MCTSTSIELNKTKLEVRLLMQYKGAIYGADFRYVMFLQIPSLVLTWQAESLKSANILHGWESQNIYYIYLLAVFYENLHAWFLKLYQICNQIECYNTNCEAWLAVSFLTQPEWAFFGSHGIPMTFFHYPQAKIWFSEYFKYPNNCSYCISVKSSLQSYSKTRLYSTRVYWITLSVEPSKILVEVPPILHLISLFWQYVTVFF